MSYDIYIYAKVQSCIVEDNLFGVADDRWVDLPGSWQEQLTKQ